MAEHVHDGRDAVGTNAPQPPRLQPDLAGRSGGRVRFTRLLALVAVAVMAALIHPRALAAVAVVAVVAAVGLIAPWLGVRAVRAQWTYPVRRGQVGRPVAVRVTLRSVSPWPVFGLLVRGGWTDPDSGAGDPVTVAVPRVAARGVREVVTTVVPTRRGVFPAHPPTLACGFPFGLRQVSAPADVLGRVLVWPEIVPLAAAARDAGGAEGGVVVRSPRSGDQGEFVGTRPYRAGEPLHRIHWKQSARHNRLIAVEARATSRRAVVLVVETDPQVHTDRDGTSSLERTLSVGASLAAAFADTGVHVTLTFETGQVFSAQNRPQLALALDAMAHLDARAGVAQDTLLEHLPARLTRGLIPLVVTTVAGWRRAGKGGWTGRRQFLVIDERDRRTAKSAARPPGLPRTVPVVPLDDPEHRALRHAWKEVAGGIHAVV